MVSFYDDIKLFLSKVPYNYRKSQCLNIRFSISILLRSDVLSFRQILNPFTHVGGGGGGWTAYALLLCFFCPLLKISLRNPYLKILDPTKLGPYKKS